MGENASVSPAWATLFPQSLSQGAAPQVTGGCAVRTPWVSSFDAFATERPSGSQHSSPNMSRSNVSLRPLTVSLVSRCPRVIWDSLVSQPQAEVKRVEMSEMDSSQETSSLSRTDANCQ